MKPVSPTRSFYDIYEGKLKQTLEIQSDQLQGVARCFDETEDVLKNKNFVQVISKAIQIIHAPDVYQAYDRL